MFNMMSVDMWMFIALMIIQDKWILMMRGLDKWMWMIRPTMISLDRCMFYNDISGSVDVYYDTSGCLLTKCCDLCCYSNILAVSSQHNVTFLHDN